MVRPGVHQRASAGDDRDLAALEERLQAFGEAFDDLLLARLAGSQVEGGLTAVDAELLGAGDGAEHLRGLEELLGRDATPVEAGPADALVFDERDAQARRGAVQGRGVPAGAAAQDDDVEVLGHNSPFRFGSFFPMAEAGLVLRSACGRQRARRIWIADAARIATAQTAARTMSVRVLTGPSWRQPPAIALPRHRRARARGPRPEPRRGSR